MNAVMPLPTIEDSALSRGNSGWTDETLQLVPALSAVTPGPPTDKPTLVIGDLHGHLDRFEALLKQEGLLDQCNDCDGLGEIWWPCTLPGSQCEYSCNHDRWIECENCEGDGWARTSKPAEVVLVGDIGHFSASGSPTGDLLTWLAAIRWADVILWGNHDRALIDPWHQHKGYMKPTPEVYHLIARARFENKLKLAHVSHRFLITHAGLHLAFRDQDIPDVLKQDPEAFTAWINEAENENAEIDKNQLGIRDAIGIRRNGRSHAGGILWRDINEKLYDPFRQVFGHSADSKSRKVRYCGQRSNTRKPHSINFSNVSYCIDIGGASQENKACCLAGIWLPDERLVCVDL